VIEVKGKKRKAGESGKTVSISTHICFLLALSCILKQQVKEVYND